MCNNRFPIVKVVLVLCAVAVVGLLLACREDPEPLTGPPSGDQGWYLLFDKMLSWSPDGKEIVYAAGGNVVLGVRSGIYVVNLETLERRLICSGPTTGHPDWSPDGERITFTMYLEIYTIRPDGTGLRQLTSGNDDQFPMYSPDGKTISFTRESADAPISVYTIPVGGGQAALLKEWAYYADWFPDGVYVSLLALDSSNKFQVARLHLAEDSIQFLTTEVTTEALAVHSKRYPLVSPSGKEIIFSANENEAKRISLYVVDVTVDPPTVKKFLAGAYYGRYSPNEKYFAYTNPYEGVIYVRDLTTGEEIKVSPGPSADCEDCALTQ